MRFIFLVAVFVVCAGLYLSSGSHLPYLEWVGSLPGDLLIHKGDLTIYMPFATACVVSLAISLLFR